MTSPTGTLPKLPLCACGCGAPVRLPTHRFLHGHAAKVQIPTTEMICAQCRKPFTVRPAIRDSRLHCSRECKAAAQSHAKLDTPLKRRVAQAMARRNMTLTALSTEAGVNYNTLRSWFQNQGRFLRGPNVAQIAAWLGITHDEAIKLQGGTGEDHRRAAAHNALASEKMVAFQQQLKTDPRLKKRIAENVARAVRGKPRTPEHLANHRASMERYWQTADWQEKRQRIGQEAKTPRGRALRVKMNLRRKYPDHREGAITALAIERLRLPPYNTVSDAKARSLLVPRGRHRRKATRGRKAQECRCIFLDDHLPTAARSPQGKVRRFEWPRLAEIYNAIPGNADQLDGLMLADWAKHHISRCTRPHQRQWRIIHVIKAG